jgi:hypothetical protein
LNTASWREDDNPYLARGITILADAASARECKKQSSARRETQPMSMKKILMSTTMLFALGCFAQTSGAGSSTPDQGSAGTNSTT